MIFDIKLGKNFRRKARLVTGGHKKKVTEFNYIQFGGITRFILYMFTDNSTH